jgi:hypothetical protein
MVSAIFKGLGTGTLLGLRNIISDEEAERRLSYENFDERTRKNVDAINMKRPVVADYDKIIQKVAEDIVAFNPKIDPLKAYDYALSLDENFLKKKNEQGFSVTNYKDLSNVFRKSNLGGGTQYQLLIDDPLDIGFNLEEEKPEEIPSDDRSVFQKIFKNDPNYAAQEYARNYGVTPGEAMSLYGESPASAQAKYTLANIYRGDEESGPRGEFKRYAGEQFTQGGLTLPQATNLYQETIMVNSKKLKTFFGRDEFGAITINEGDTAPEFVQLGVLYGNQVFGKIAQKNGTVGPGIVTEFGNRVAETLEQHQNIQEVYSALGRETQLYDMFINPDVESEKTSTQILDAVEKKLKGRRDLDPNAVIAVTEKLKNSFDTGEEYTDFRNGKVNTESVLADIQNLDITQVSMELLQSETVKRPKGDTEYSPAEQAIIKNQIDSSTEGKFLDPLELDKIEESGKLNIDNIPGIGDLAENNPFITENSVDTSRDDTLNTEDNQNLTIGSKVDDAIETVSSGVEQIISARDARLAKGRIQTLNRNIKVQIAQGNNERALEMLNEATALANTVPGIASMDEYKNIIELAENLKPTEVAARYQGGFMTPRLNTGGTIDNITVTAPRENTPNFNVRNSLVNPLFRGSAIPYQDGTLDPDIRGSAMMEGDEGYDEAYNYTQRMQKQAKENLAKQTSNVFTDTPSIEKPSFMDRAKTFVSGEIDDTADLAKDVIALKNPLNIGTKVIQGTAKGVGNLVDKIFKTDKGSISASSINKFIGQPNQLVNNLISDAIDSGAATTKDLIE